MTEKEFIFKNTIEAMNTPDFTPAQREVVAKQLAADLGMDWEDLSVGMNLETVEVEGRQSRAVNPVICKIFPVLCR